MDACLAILIAGDGNGYGNLDELRRTLRCFELSGARLRDRQALGGSGHHPPGLLSIKTQVALLLEANCTVKPGPAQRVLAASEKAVDQRRIKDRGRLAIPR